LSPFAGYFQYIFS